MNPLGCYIDGKWLPGEGPTFLRTDPTFDQIAWQGPAASDDQIDRAVAAAHVAAPTWARHSVEQRSRHLDLFGKALTAHANDLLEAICLETGKPRWETRTEIDALHKKIDLTRQAYSQRLAPADSVKDGLTSATRYKPLRTVAVLGPFNLPAHLPNGQILPALLAGNTVVFKPSELTPHVGEIYAQCMHEADLPTGVFNLIHGSREQGAALASHPGIDGVFFTGSHAGGVALSTMLASRPEKLLALEMGGNNPLVVASVSNLDAAAYAIIQSAFITAGQRCTCARRLILLQGSHSDRLLERLHQLTERIVVGPYTQTPEPFIGPVISDAAAQRLLDAQSSLISRGAKAILPLRSAGPRTSMLAPGILEVTAVADRADEELFGPMLQVIRVADFEAALVEANRTRFGLAAALLSDDPDLYQHFLETVHAGIINWNRPTTGASGNLPFGGRGASGNHRPAGFFAVDFCADPVACLESPTLTLPAAISPGISL